MLAPLLGLGTIQLDELIERAALQTRVDRKYLVDIDRLAVVLADLDGTTRVLEVDGRRAIDYASTYYDNAELHSYHLAAHRRRRRYKVRARRYGQGATFLEVKTRGARGSTVKERTERPIPEADLLLDDDGIAYVDTALEAAGIGALPDRLLHPTLRTHYTRTTVFLPATASRATLDMDLRWSDSVGRGAGVPRLVVVETKSGATPSGLDRLLWSHGHRPVGLSKYGTGMALLHPGLPANRWRRVIDRVLLPQLAPAQPAAITDIPSSTASLDHHNPWSTR
ncbi:VTC domain-containing protein [Nakamurella sp. YIM 132087]|uniref:VTC domain-containing protein n=1 Tax=Nakamurella alba TaxID=2665158 RepID=A0A7K1FKA8_9ACTN|nr:VTC domain-containing protein [Nakamurella alba]